MWQLSASPRVSEAAKAAGADVVDAEELCKEIPGGIMELEKLMASPDMYLSSLCLQARSFEWQCCASLRRVQLQRRLAQTFCMQQTIMSSLSCALACGFWLAS